MSTIFRLAVRNLLRTPRRTVLTLIAVIAGVSLSIVGRAFLDGMDEAVIAGAIDSTVGHVTARPADYPTRPGQHPVDDLLDVDDAARRLLEEEARAFTARTYLSPLLFHDDHVVPVVGIGFDPERDGEVFPRRFWKIEGAMPQPGSADVAVSSELARLLELTIGDTLALKARTHQKTMSAIDARVVGVVQTGNLALDLRSVWLASSLAADLVGSEKPSHLTALLDDRRDAGAFAEKLSVVLGEDASTITWATETEELLRLQAVRRKALNGVVFILLALAAFGIANTILMAAYERVREVGTLRALGMTKRGVVGLFLIEGTFLGVVGGIAGGTMAGALVAYWQRNPIDLSEILAAQGSKVAIAPLIYTQLDVGAAALAVVLAALVAAGASVYPARVASSISVADAVRAD